MLEIPVRASERHDRAMLQEIVTPPVPADVAAEGVGLLKIRV
jgi:hypothetical protein